MSTRARILVLASLEDSVLAALQTSSFGPFDPTADEGIAPGTRWDDIPDDWCCPDCGAAKSDFDMVEVECF